MARSQVLGGHGFQRAGCDEYVLCGHSFRVLRGHGRNVHRTLRDHIQHFM